MQLIQNKYKKWILRVYIILFFVSSLPDIFYDSCLLDISSYSAVNMFNEWLTAVLALSDASNLHTASHTHAVFTDFQTVLQSSIIQMQLQLWDNILKQLRFLVIYRKWQAKLL
jgi:hypothetical protein